MSKDIDLESNDYSLSIKTVLKFLLKMGKVKEKMLKKKISYVSKFEGVRRPRRNYKIRFLRIY